MVRFTHQFLMFPSEHFMEVGRLMNKPIYVKDLFEEDFIEKFLTLLYSEELAITKYKIDIQKIVKEAERNIYRLAGEYASAEISFSGNPQKDKEKERKYFEDLAKEKQLHDKYHFVYKSEDKYTFESFLKQTYLGRNIKSFFFEDSEFFFEPLGNDDSDILLNELIDTEKFDICSVKLPFAINKKNQEKFSFKYDNKEATFLKAYKIIIEEVFNYTLEELSKDILYKSFINSQDPELIDILKIEAIFETIKERFINFRQSFFEHFEIFMQFAYAEALIFSSKSKLYYAKNKVLDKDKQKTDFYNNVINKLLDSKEAIYKEKSNLDEKRLGNTKVNISKDILENTSVKTILQYVPLIEELRKNNWMAKFQKEEKYRKDFELVKQYFCKTENKKELKKFPNIYRYLLDEKPEKIAIAMFIEKEQKPIKVNTLYAKVLASKKLQMAVNACNNQI